MVRQLLTFIIITSVIILYSCSKKSHPEKSTVYSTISNSNTSSSAPADTSSLKKKTFKPKPKDIIPNVIVVNDKAAHKSVDGRFYYDLLGHRYWKNYKDGKYYLFNKKMYSDPNFKAPSK